ncbi:hypothetical protein PS870_00929 [Pseudomonas fluorescens]|uniref:Uncharacterized protein n=1 Tax=Pseudomonas fluorescens TaxID=294 RepID=A0A5E7HKS2_PSEFL|nr:hypothetical protein [Pseudomonas fluorescens]VVO63896.1 hypothetical protein PS870_00929 [Pseudomonas fluorescens]
MIVKIAFDPANLKAEDEAWPAFNAGGLTLKIWALYKKHFVTSQYFRDSLVQMAELFERMLDIDDHEVRPYMNIDEFMGYLGACGIYGTVVGTRHKEMAEWVVRYWDYFNLSTQRAVTLQFKVVKEVDETLTICGLGPTSAI